MARDRRCCPYSDMQGSGLLQRELTVVPHIARRKSCFDHFELKPILASSVTGGGQMRPRDFIKVVAGSKPAMFEGRKVAIRWAEGQNDRLPPWRPICFLDLENRGPLG